MKKILGISAVIVILVLIAINHYIILSGRKHVITLEEASEQSADAILVLGAGLKNGKPGKLLSDRLDTAIALYHKGKTKKMIMSGDHRSQAYDEVTAMKDYAVTKGVPLDAIYLDHYGIDTYDSLYRAKTVFQAKKLLVVTQKYHLYRALYMGDRLELDISGVASQIEQFEDKIQQDVREFFARGKAVYRILRKETAKYQSPVISLQDSGLKTHTEK